MLVYFTRRRKDLPFSWMFWMFAAFIVGCGTTHLMEVVTSYVPLYRLAALVKVLTAVASVGTAVLLVPLIPRALALRSPRELEREIAERQRTQQELEAQAQLLELAHDAILVRDLDDRITFWNQGAVEQYGWSKEEAASHVTHALLQTTFPEPLEDIRATLLKEGRWEGEVALTRRDGSQMVVASRWALRRDNRGKPVAVLEINRDVTARKQAELALHRANAELERRVAERTEALRQSEEEYRQIFEMSAVGTAQVAPDGRWRRVNQRLCEIVGYSREELQALSFQAITHPEDLEADLALVRKLLAGEVGTYSLEKRYVGKSGRAVWVNLTVSMVRRPSGEPDYFISVVEDISGRKDLEGRVREHTAALAAGNEALQAEIAERRRAEEALRDADRRKNEFLATLAHELRNPLAPLRNAVELLRRAESRADLTEQAHGMMDRQLGVMVRLIDDLLDVSRITRGKLQLRKERVELAAVVRGAVEAAHPSVEAQAHELTVTLPPQPIHLDADAVRLAQVFSNLLTNAAKYTERGGRIWLTAERQGGEVVVSVRDTGIGIAAEHLPQLFQSFSQVSSALERSQGGLGIGLSLVRGLVDLQGGRVEARSDGPGRGSEFLVRLPVVEAPAEASTEPGGDGEKARRGRRCRVLVVDDNRDAADSLAMMLGLLGHDIQTAYDGPEAIQAAATFRPEVVLLDIGLPGRNGYEVARHIRGQPWGKSMVLVAITGWGQEEDKLRAAEAGFDDHLVKPVDLAALEKMLAGLCV